MNGSVPALLVLVCAALMGCGGDARERNAHVAPDSAGAFPRIGIAVTDGSGWCAEFANDTTRPPVTGDARVSIVFGVAATPVALTARVAGPHLGDCPAAFAQSRWIDYTAYHLELDSVRTDTTTLPMVGLVVVSPAVWQRGDGVVRADLDRDGVPEEMRRCAADEGEHFTVWSVATGRRVRRWHEYFDWGAFTDPTCRAGENGRDST